jgi:hypothetical protein
MYFGYTFLALVVGAAYAIVIGLLYLGARQRRAPGAPALEAVATPPISATAS